MRSLHEDHHKFIDWLIMPKALREPSSQAQLAEQLGVHVITLSEWKRKPLFKAEWERRLAEMNVSPEKIQSVVDMMYEMAFDASTRAQDRLSAAKAYLTYTGRLAPNSNDDLATRAEKRVDELSDEELQEQLAAHERSLKDEVAKRRLRAV